MIRIDVTLGTGPTDEVLARSHTTHRVPDQTLIERLTIFIPKIALGSKAAMIHSGQNPLSAPESSSTGSHLQPTAVTRSSSTAGVRASPDLNIITENDSRIETGAVSHSRAARSGLPAGRDNGELKGKRQGEVL